MSGERWAGRVVLLVVIVSFLPALPSSVAPSHDALQIYTAYWTYISGLITEGRLVEWIPFSRYGTPATPILMYVSPISYVTGAIGAALHIRDTLLLFKFSVALEYLLFAAGVMRFGKLLFRSAWVSAFVAIVAVFSSPWIMSLDGNFHAFYMTPWILAELVLFFETNRARHLGFAALLSIFACVGNVPYFPPFLLLQLFVFSVPLAWFYRDRLKTLALNPYAWLWIGGAAALAAVHFVAVAKGMEGLAIFSPGRDPVTNRVPKHVFLTYAGVTKPIELLTELVEGTCTNGDNTFYMGLATLVLAPLSFLLRPTPALRAIQTLAVFLLLFSTGGLVASVSYYFPGMFFYRHIAIVFGLFRLLALFAAGFVIDRGLSERQALGWWLAAPVLLLAVVELIRAQQFGPPLALVLLHFTTWMQPVYVRLVAYLLVFWLAYRFQLQRHWRAVVMVAVALDLGSFWADGWLEWPRLNASQSATLAELATPKNLVDPGPRFTAAQAGTRARLFRFVDHTPPLHFPFSTLYVHTYFWTGEDPCVPRARTDFLTAEVAQWFTLHGVRFEPEDRTENRVLRDPEMAASLACDHPRVASSVKMLTSTRGYDWIHMDVENHEPAAAPLSISEAHHPDWTATIDGHHAAIADGAFLSVMVPNGRHSVDLRFHQPVAGPLRTLESILAGIAAFLLMSISVRQFA